MGSDFKYVPPNKVKVHKVGEKIKSMCPDCEGTKMNPDKPDEPCKECKGTGQVESMVVRNG